MKRLATAVLIAAAFIAPGLAEAADKITVGQTFSLATALRNLDGHMVVIKQGGAENAIMIPWDFGSGSLRLRIANNLNILDAVAKMVEDTRQNIVKEITKKSGTTEIKPSTPEMDDYQKQYGDVATQPAAGTQDLARIKASELRLDRNEIPGTVLSALKPILDDDVSGK